MFNASLEKFKIQCDSKVFVFNPRESTEVPDYPMELVGFVYAQTKDRGVFPIYPNMSEADIKKAERQALINYRSGFLNERIVNYIAQQDEFKKNGITLSEDPRFKRAKRWSEEILKKLELEAPLEQELSFLEEKAQDLFNPEMIRAENGLKVKNKGGRPKKVVQSFNETDIKTEA